MFVSFVFPGNDQLHPVRQRLACSGVNDPLPIQRSSHESACKSRVAAIWDSPQSPASIYSCRHAERHTFSFVALEVRAATDGCGRLPPLDVITKCVRRAGRGVFKRRCATNLVFNNGLQRLADDYVQVLAPCTMKSAANVVTLAIVVGALMILSLVMLGYRQYEGGMPLNATCSVIISAACHRPEDDKEAHLFPVQWGVVPSAPSGSSALKGVEKTSAAAHSALDTSIGDSAAESGSDYCGEEVVELAVRGSEGVSGLQAKEATISVHVNFELASANIGHCCFTTYRDVETPREGLYYR